MASPGAGASSDEMTPLQAAAVMDERRRKRKQSNRESAQRSRARKKRQLDELQAEVELLRGKNSGMAAAVHAALQNFAHVEAENRALRAQVLELSTRLHSLTDLLHCLDMNESMQPHDMMSLINPLNSPQMMNNLQPIMASPHMYNYY